MPQFDHFKYFSFFTKYSLLDNYGFMSGLLSRISLKILPQYMPDHSIEKVLFQLRENNEGRLHIDQFMSYVDSECQHLNEELNQSIVSLGSKIVAFGLDKKIKYKIETLGLDTNLFLELNSLCTQIDTVSQEHIRRLIANLKLLIQALRGGKNVIGTSIQLTYKTILIKKYLDRLKLLADLKYDIENKETWEHLIKDYMVESKNHHSLYFYFKYHFDLLLFQIVEHSSYKGEKYIASNRDEHFSVFKKSMKAGVLISVFACIKLFLDQLGATNFSSALMFGLNYAFCFMIVKEIGGIIATKQPAMTASTIAKKIDGNNDYKIDGTSDVVGLIRDVSRTQVISFVGNVIVVIPCAFLIFFCLGKLGLELISESQILYINSGLDPANWKNAYYAGIAGIFLSLAGLVSGFVDNRVKFSKFQERLANTRMFSFLFSGSMAKSIADKTSKKMGAHLGNLTLGLLLGFAFLVETLFGFPFDIRHIAFSGAYLGGLLNTYPLPITEFLYLLSGVGLIGLVNFIVSFSLTLLIAFKTRGITFKEFLDIMSKLMTDFIKNPIQYFIFKRVNTLG